jgi:hypothetical protein
MRSRKVTAADPERLFLAFAVAVAAFHHLPTIGAFDLGVVVDLLTPLAVVGTAALLLFAVGAAPLPIAVAVVAALLYTDGHGIHLAANDINNLDPTGRVADRVEFWDERFGHTEWHLGWFGLILSFCLAERARGGGVRAGRIADIAVLPLGFTLFTSTVEGQTWPLMLLAGLGFCAWAVARRRPLLVRCAAAFALAALLVAVWAIWQGGVPEFTDVWGV